jgi:lipid-binding SYLF domain-containing protein
MRRLSVTGPVLLIIGALIIGLLRTDDAHAKQTSKQRKQAEIRRMAQETLNHLYKIHPGARNEIERSAGYAVFDDFGAHIFFLSTARGKGIAVDNETKTETFMKMLSAGAGPGLGIKDYRAVFVFETKKSFHDFIAVGLGLSAQADAAAKAGHEGEAFAGAIAIAPGVWVYQITEAGLALQATLQGTKYYRANDLN